MPVVSTAVGGGLGGRPWPGWNRGRGLRGEGLSGMLKSSRSAQQSRAGRVLPAEGTAWIRARHVCKYCFSDEQPQGVPGRALRFMCMIIYALGVHTAFLSGVRTVITLSPLPTAWGQTGALCLQGNVVSISE